MNLVVFPFKKKFEGFLYPSKKINERFTIKVDSKPIIGPQYTLKTIKLSITNENCSYVSFISSIRSFDNPWEEILNCIICLTSSKTPL